MIIMQTLTLLDFPLHPPKHFDILTWTRLRDDIHTHSHYPKLGMRGEYVIEIEQGRGARIETEMLLY